LTLAGVLTRDAQLRRKLVIEADGRLLRQVVNGRQIGEPAAAADLVVVVRARRLRSVWRGVTIQDRQAGGIQPIRRNLAEDAAVLEAGGLVGGAAGARGERILDEVEQRAVVVERTGEIASSFGCCRHPQTDRVAVVDRLVGRAVLMAVKEEQLVVAARFANRATD